MLSDSEPDPLDKLETIIKKVGKNINEKNEHKRKAKLVGRKVCSTNNFRCTTNILQDDFKKFDDSVQKYVNDVRSCTGLDGRKSSHDEVPESHVMMKKMMSENNILKREGTFTLEDRKERNRLKRKEKAKKKHTNYSSDEQESLIFSQRTTISRSSISSDDEISNMKSNAIICIEQEKPAENPIIDKAKQEELEKEIQARQQAREAAYKSWCERKAEAIKKKAEKERKLKEELEKRKEKEEKRRKIQEENYRSWLTRKKEEKKLSELIQEMRQREAEKKSEAEKRFNEEKAEAAKNWKARKMAEAKQLKEIKMQEYERQTKLSERRMREASEMFSKWLSTVHLKPRPPPLNKGEQSFVVQNIGWINPVPWRSVTTDISSDNDDYYY